jgi:hypothetical protein
MPEEVFDVMPGELDITGVVGDDLVLPFDFDIDLTGYTFTAFIELDNVPFPATMNFTITPINLANGLFNASLTAAQTASIGPGSNKRWYLRWTNPSSLTRTIIYGTCSLTKI